MIEIYTDGSALANGKENNKGGFGVVVMKDNKILHLYNSQSYSTTNNIEELKALLYALELTQTLWKHELCKIKSDSAYCVRAFNEWLDNWFYNNWHKSDGKIIENIDLMKELYKYKQIDFPNFTVEKVKGHNGNIWNEAADALATSNQAKLATIFKNNNINYNIEKIFDLQ